MGSLRIGLAGVLIVALAGCGGTPAPSPSPTESGVPPTATTAPIPDLTAAATVPLTPGRSPSGELVEPTGDLLFFRGSRVEGGQIGSAWVAPLAGGPPFQLGPAIEASWAADGRSIHLVSRDDNCVPKLTTVSVDQLPHVSNVIGEGLRSLDDAFAWSPDGAQVVFLRYHNGAPPRMCGSQGGTYESDAVVQDMILMNADGTDKHVLVPMVWPQRPITWSPDGTWIAFANEAGGYDGTSLRDTVVVRAADGEQSLLTSAPREGMSSPRWSPDGTRLAFGFSVEGVNHFGIITVGGATLLDLGGGADYAHEFSSSPDGEAVATAFDAVTDGILTSGGILIYRTDGSGRRALSLTDVQTFSEPPAWSPDGGWLAYVRTAGQQGGWGGIALVRTDGSSRRELPETAGAEWVVWQPAP